jgi:hypothetical protein
MFNGSTLPKGVFDDFNPASPINQSHVKTGFGQLACGFRVQELPSAGVDPLYLSLCDTRGSAGAGFAPLHLDKDQGLTLTKDQVNLSACTAPTVLSKAVTALFIMLSHLIFGCRARQIGPLATIMTSPRSSHV